VCRHLAYVGPPVLLADLVLHQPHSLLHQSWAPTDMRGGGTINADGFGIGWLVGDPGDGGVARRYRRDVPMWTDASLPGLAASISSSAIMAAARSATAGMPVTETACAPFVAGVWMFSHNGVIDGWPASVAPLADGLPRMDLMMLDAPTDSAFLWALVRQHLSEGRSPATALTSVVGDVLAVAPRSRLNLLLSDGRNVAATTVGHTLWLRHGRGSVTVSSEALDPGEPGWQQVPDLSLVMATAADFSIAPLDQGSS
jgi:gamma-glutamyl hercynylcysteine S-oxide hydrolase